MIEKGSRKEKKISTTKTFSKKMLDYNVVCNYKTSENICSDLIIACNAITNNIYASTYIIRQDNFIFGV